MISERQYRQIISYHPEMGHLYVPNLTVRVRYGSGGYYLTTDALGFRNNPDAPTGKLSILILGDSYAAGDGVTNADRFGDLLARQFDCSVTNLAVNGYGLDQQLLVYEQYRDEVPHDIVLLCPHMDDLNRNLAPFRVGKNRKNENIRIPKPFFKITPEGALELENVPVPREREVVELDAQESAPQRPLNELKNKVKHGLNRAIGKHTLGKLSYPELNDPESDAWQLGKALLKKFAKITIGKKLVVMPLPYNYVVGSGEPQYYDRIFKEAIASEVHYINPTKYLTHFFKKNGESTFLPLCGHFAPNTHALLAEVLGKELSAFGLEKRKQAIESTKQKPSGYVLGISCYYHDAAAALIHQGKIVSAAQEERFTRVKHDKRFPTNAIHFCLESAQLDINDLEAICFYDDEALTIERVLHNYAWLPERKQDAFWKNASSSLFTKLLLTKNLRDSFGYTGRVFKTKHHHSHAASTFYPSPFQEAAIVVIDGVGEWACSTIGHGRGSSIELLKQQHYPHSLGLLYSAITYFCGFKVNSGEYKLMGLAPYGRPIYADKIKEHLLTMRDDGSILLHLEYFDFLSAEKMTNDKMAELFDGPERAAESRITQREMDLAASLQQVTEEILDKILRHARELTGSDYCVMAGGVALNCVANGKLVKAGIFKDIWVQPAAGDAGGALGAALDYYYQKLHTGTGKVDRSEQTHSYFGPAFSESEIEAFLLTQGAQFHRFENKTDQLTRMIRSGHVIGYFDGGMEFGPRALGNRSFLADATNTEMQRKVNLKIKFRESFRPFAPIVAEDRISDYFDFDRPSPFMLMVAPVREHLRRKTSGMQGEDMIETVNQIRSVLPAITHVDYSARLQSVDNKGNANPDMYALLKRIERDTGYAVLVNTSFNVRGEPIVCSPEDAYRCFMRTETDVLVLGNHYLMKTEQPHWNETEKWEEEFMLD